MLMPSNPIFLVNGQYCGLKNKKTGLRNLLCLQYQKRIVACVDHTSAVFFRRQHYHINICLDAVFKFFLWLNGKDCDKATFTGRKHRVQASCHKGQRGYYLREIGSPLNLAAYPWRFHVAEVQTTIPSLLHHL